MNGWRLLIVQWFVSVATSLQVRLKNKLIGQNLRAKSSKEPDSSAPFCDALIDVVEAIKHKFFFPGHSGGINVPSQLRKIFFDNLDSSPLKFDLPELDGLDNIHNPEVRY